MLYMENINEIKFKCNINISQFCNTRFIKKYNLKEFFDYIMSHRSNTPR